MSTNGNTCYRKGNTMNAPNHRLVDGVSDVYAPTPTDGSIIKWTTANQRWENAPGFGSYFKSGYVDLDAVCTAWGAVTYARRLYWGQAGSLIVLFIPSTVHASVTAEPPGPVTFTAALPNNLWPAEPVVDHKLALNLNVHSDCTITISTTGTITIYKGILYGGILGNFDALTGTACGGDMMYVPYKINFVVGSSGPVIPSPIPALRFIDLTDTQAAYITPYSLLRVKGAANGVSEFDLQATLPALNQFRLTSGTSALSVTSSSTIDQDLATTASPQFANLTVNNKLTVTGPIDPTGIQLTSQSTNPLDSRSIWTDGTIVYFGQIPIGSNIAWWFSVDKTMQAAMKSTATTTLTGAGGVGELATTVAAALDGAVIEIRSNLGYSPIVLPTAKRLTIRVAQGYGAYLTGANCCTLVNGCRDITIIGLGWDTCTTTDANALGSAISLAQSAVVTRIIFAQCNLRVCASSAVMMSYHQSIGGDNYATANAYPGEFSTNIAFVDCSFNKATTDGSEGAALALRGVEGAYIKGCSFNCQGVGGRGIQLQNNILCWVEGNYVTGGAGTANGEGIKLDRLGAPAYYNSGYFIRNISKSNKQGIDIDDFDAAVAIGNHCLKNTNEGLCLCGVGQTTIASNVCWENNDGIAIEVGVTSYKLYNNVSFLNTANNFRLDGGGSPNDSNLTSQVASAVGADSVPFTTSGILTSKNVNDALNEIAAVSGVTEINGFSEANRLIRTLSIVDGAAPTFTIAGGPYQYYQHGTLYTRTTDTVAITNVEGMHYFYYNAATLSHTTSVTQALFRDYVFVGMCYWQYDATPANAKHLFIGDETHAFMDWATHWLEHSTQGTQWMGGLALNSFVIGDGSLNVHATFGWDAGSILDEDLTHTISLGTVGVDQYRVFYRLGASGVWRIFTFDSAPLALFAGIGTRPTWNQYTGGAWQLTEVTDNKFFLVHIFATNAYSAAGAGNSALRMIAIVGQAEYGSVVAARAGANNELASLQLSGLPAVEFVAIGTVIYQTNQLYTNVWKAKVVLTDTSANYIDWRQKKALNSTTAPTNHHNLSDLNTYDDHINYPLVVGSLSSTGRVGDILPMDEMRMYRLPASGLPIKIGNTASTYLAPAMIQYSAGTSGGAQRIWQAGVYYDGTATHPAYDFAIQDTQTGTVTAMYCNYQDHRVNAPFGFTSTLAGATNKILDFGSGAAPGNYSYLGAGANYAFGVQHSGGMFISADDWITARIGNNAAYYFDITTGTAPLGTVSRFRVGGTGLISATNTMSWPTAFNGMVINLSPDNGVGQWIGRDTNTGFGCAQVGGLKYLQMNSATNLVFNIDTVNGATTRAFAVSCNTDSPTIGAGTVLLKVEENGTSGKISGAVIKDEDNMASNSADHVPTQQSTKAYVDSFFSSGTFNVVLSGGSITLGNIVCNWQRVNRTVTGVFIATDTTYGTPSSNCTFTTASAIVPAAIRPATQQILHCWNVGHLGVVPGELRVKTDGNLELTNLNIQFYSGSPSGLYHTSTCTWTLD